MTFINAPAQSHRILLSSRGISLIATLTAIAALGLLIVVFMTLYQSMTGIMTKSLVSNDADQLVRAVTGLFSSRTFCPTAFPPGTVWDGQSVISVSELGGGGNQVAHVGQVLGGSGGSGPFRVARISLGPPIDPATGTRLAAGSSGFSVDPTNYVLPGGGGVAGTPHRAYTGSILIDFEPTVGAPAPNLVGGTLRSRYVTLKVGVNLTTGAIDDCPGAGTQAKHFGCDPTSTMGMDPAEVTACYARRDTLRTRPYPFTCDVFFFVKGFDGQGISRCGCDVACGSYLPYPDL